MKSRIIAILTLILGISLFSVALAWTGPTAAPTGGNVTAPVNVGTTNQVKSANLGVDGLAVFGNSLLQASSYLNWGTTSGSAGYGFRDNAGIMQFRNSGDPSGIWYNVSSSTSSGGGTSGSSQWLNGTAGAIYYSGGNVGIGTATPGAPLDVNTSAGDLQVLASADTGNVTLNSPSTGHDLQFDAGGDIDFYAQGDDVASCHTSHSHTTCSAPEPDMSVTSVADGYGAEGLYIDNDVEATDAYIWNDVYSDEFLYWSDERLKKDIVPLTGSLSTVLQLQPVTYYWKNPSSGTGLQIGFVAQQVQKVVPELVSTNASTTLEAVDYAKMTPLLVGSVQQLNQEIQDQQQVINTQQQEIDQLQQEVQAIQNKQ